VRHADPASFASALTALAVLAYLSRYTHRVAISNSRLISMDERGVTFRRRSRPGSKPSCARPALRRAHRS